MHKDSWGHGDGCGQKGRAGGTQGGLAVHGEGWGLTERAGGTWGQLGVHGEDWGAWDSSVHPDEPSGWAGPSQEAGVL